MAWFRKQKLFERDPKELSLEFLSLLQGSLVAKLILVNEELQRRYNGVADLSNGMNEGDEHKERLRHSAKELRGLNLILNQVLAKITGKT